MFHLQRDSKGICLFAMATSAKSIAKSRTAHYFLSAMCKLMQLEHIS